MLDKLEEPDHARNKKGIIRGCGADRKCLTSGPGYFYNTATQQPPASQAKLAKELKDVL